jgi:hypothetical protein
LILGLCPILHGQEEGNFFDKLIHIIIASPYSSDGMGSLHPTKQEKNICSKILED